MIAMALVTVNELSLNAHLIAFAMAACSAAVVAVKSMSTNGLACHQTIAILAMALIGSVTIHLAVLGVVVGSQEIFCVDSVRDCWAEDTALVHSLLQIVDAVVAAACWGAIFYNAGVTVTVANRHLIAAVLTEVVVQQSSMHRRLVIQYQFRQTDRLAVAQAHQQRQLVRRRFNPQADLLHRSVIA